MQIQKNKDRTGKKEIYIMPKFSKIAEKCSLLGMEPDGVTVTRGSNYARVIELQGKDYSGLDQETTAGFFGARKMFFDKLDSRVTVSLHTHRFLAGQKSGSEKYSIEIAEKISEKWCENFSRNYRTRHFLVFSTVSDVMDSFLAIFSREKKGAGGNLKTRLEEIKNDALIRFRDYNPVELRGDALASYWAFLCNGRSVYQREPEAVVIEDMFFGTDLYFPRGKKYMEYDRGDKKRYSGWLIIKMPAAASGPDLLASLLQVQHDFSIYQIFSAFAKDEAERYLQDKLKNAESFLSSSEIIQAELTEAAQMIQADQISLVRHRWALEVFSDTPEALESAISEIRNKIEFFGYRTAREGVNIEALFWSRFPEMENYNPRQRNITSENAADWSSMDAVGQGLGTCSWGKNITDFKTVTGGVYSFVFHVSPEKTALGNTIVIGGSSSGKTTLISFLISQCFKYPNFRALLFDRLRGLEVFSRFHNGGYIDFLDGVEVNPLQLENTNINRTFLSQFFQMLLPSFSGPENQKIIDDAIRQIMTLPKADRNLENISDAFGLGGEGTIRSALDRWLPEGSNGGYFSGKKDALELSALTTFDMTYLLESPDILGPMTYYIFHRLFSSVSGDGGYIVFLDEMANYLKSSVFSPKIEILLQEIRKTDGVFVGAVQDAGTLLDNPIAPKILNNTGTYILFSEPRAQEKHYIEGLGLNEREFSWIREDHPRHALIKRKSGESVMFNVDLASLGKYLRIFSSDVADVKKLIDCRKAGGDWKSAYLA